MNMSLLPINTNSFDIKATPLAWLGYTVENTRSWFVIKSFFQSRNYSFC